MSNTEKELNKMLEDALAGIFRLLKTFIFGIWAGIKKLRSKGTIAGFAVAFLLAGFGYVFRELIFKIQAPGWVRGCIYWILLAMPLWYLYIIGSLKDRSYIDAEKIFEEIDFKGKDGKTPVLCGTERDGKLLIYIFKSTIPVDEWRSKKPLLETALDCTILKIENGLSKRVVRVTTLPSDYKIPIKVDWEDKYLRKENGVIVAGVSALREIEIDLNKTPHILVAGETGSGKSVILHTLLWQFINQASRVFMLDFKGGVEFGIDYERYGEVVTERRRALKLLEQLEKENEKRLKLFRQMRCKNIGEYNRKAGKNLCRVGVFCDEVAEMMDKKGAAKEERELMEKIEGKISTLARLSRATGINLILGMQRPDANVLTGQIKNNIPVRISGRFADKTASEIVLGNTDAVYLPETKGRFLCKIGNSTEEFQAYYFDDDSMLKDVFVEVGDMLTGDSFTNSAIKPKEAKAPKVKQREPVMEKADVAIKPAENLYKNLTEEEFEAERDAMDEYELNFDFFPDK